MEEITRPPQNSQNPGGSQERRCPSCGAAMPPGARFCGSCGMESAPTPSAAPMEAASDAEAAQAINPAPSPPATPAAPVAPVAPSVEAASVPAQAATAEGGAERICPWCDAVNPRDAARCVACNAVFPTVEGDEALERAAMARMQSMESDIRQRRGGWWPFRSR